MARIAAVDLPRNKRMDRSRSPYLYGIGQDRARTEILRRRPKIPENKVARQT